MKDFYGKKNFEGGVSASHYIKIEWKVALEKIEMFRWIISYFWFDLEHWHFCQSRNVDMIKDDRQHDYWYPSLYFFPMVEKLHRKYIFSLSFLNATMMRILSSNCKFFFFSKNATCTFFFGFCKRGSSKCGFFHISFWWLGWQRVGGDWVEEGGPPPSPASIEVLFRWWPSRNTVVCRVRFHMSWASLNFKIQLF